MRVVITGGRGFIGRALAQRLKEGGTLAGREIDDLVVFDLPDGDVRDADQAAAVIRDGAVVFHLASMVSGECEQDFDAALSVNLEGGRNVLEACRARRGVRLVLASTLAVYGGNDMPQTVADETKPNPQTTYGSTKAVCELLVTDYTRKGFLDGRAPRLPTVIVRPGEPNAAASSFASAVFREPLDGRDYALPVGLDTRVPVIGARTAVRCLIRLAEVESEAIGDDRALNLPSISVTVGEMVESLRRVARDRRLGRVTVEPDAVVESIVRTWPVYASSQRASMLGLPKDEDLDSIVRAYIEDWVT